MLIIGLAGDWELARATPPFGPLVEEGPHGGMSYCQALGLEFRKGNLPSDIARLLEFARAVPGAPLQARISCPTTLSLVPTPHEKAPGNTGGLMG